MRIQTHLALLAIVAATSACVAESAPPAPAISYSAPRPRPRPFPITSVGCFRDTGDSGGTPGRDLNGLMMSVTDMTVEQCVSACASRGFTYAATQDGNQCFCGDAYGRLGPSNACSSACAGNPHETCGGVWANSVYQVGTAKRPAIAY